MAANPDMANKPGYDENGYPVRGISGGAILVAIWSGSGTTSAPNANLYADGQIGANTGGAATGLTYHVVSGAWVPTGGTVANLYGA